MESIGKTGMSKDISDFLSALPKEALVKFITQLYGENKDLNRRIDTLMIQNNPDELFKALKKRVQSLKRSSRFIGYNESFDFSRTLDALLHDIKILLLPLSPKKSFELVDLFLATANNTFERVDDSAGCVGDSYRYGVTLWLETASAWQQGKEPCKKDWQQEIYTIFQNNDYGVYDGLLPGSAELLDEEALRQLAWRFESEARKALKTPADEDKNYNFAASHACIGLRSVAEALNDIELYERATLITSPKPNGLQKESLATFSLRLSQPASALKWLDAPWDDRFEKKRLELLDECYQQADEAEKLLQLRRDYYQQYPNFHSLSRLLEVSPEPEKNKLLTRALDDAKAMGDLTAAVDMLLKMEAVEAAESLIVSRSDQLANCFYGSLRDFIEVFEKSGRPLAALLCYRALLEDILNQGRSKAYHYAARYYQKIQALDKTLSQYDEFPDAVTYEAAIKAKHGRKRAFWTLVENAEMLVANNEQE